MFNSLWSESVNYLNGLYTSIYSSNDITRLQYNEVADAYSKTTEHPLRQLVEQYTILTEVEPFMKHSSNLNVMDMACGDGFFTRFLKSRFPENIKFIVGVDISDEMIAIAKDFEIQDPKGIQYLRSDASLLNSSHSDYSSSYDVIVAGYFLNYAQNKAMLQDFCNTIYNCLKPNGKFITLNINVKKDPRKLYDNHTQYGVASVFCSELIDDNYKDVMDKGHRIEINRFVPSDPDTCAIFDNHYLSKATYDECFQTAGFSKWEWKPLVVDPKGLQDDFFPAGFWDTLSNPLEAGGLCIVLTK